jgi:hypothetical protein
MPQPATHPKKPLGIKNYGSIAHLPNSRMGEGNHKCHEGQARIATLKTRDKHDRVIVQEKLDGSNVGVALVNGVLCPLGRSGYLAAEVDDGRGTVLTVVPAIAPAAVLYLYRARRRSAPCDRR